MEPEYPSSYHFANVRHDAPKPYTYTATSNTITISGTSIYGNGTYTSGSTTVNPNHWVVNQSSLLASDPTMMSLQLKGGTLKIYYDGRVEVPDIPMDEASREFWEHLEQMAQRSIGKAMRTEAARLVREILPTLVTLDEYQLATLPHAVAMAMAKTP